MSARWYSKYQMEIKDKQLSEEAILNASKYKTELKDVIDKDNHRDNIDRAKKKAVTQHMDWDGFHQMVLGADLKGLKSNELYKLKPTNSLLNTYLIQKDFGKKTDFQKDNFSVENNLNNIDNITTCSENTLTIRDFEKKFKELANQSKQIEYILSLQEDQLKNIISSLEIQTFLEILKIFPSFLLEKINSDTRKSSDDFDFLIIINRLKLFTNSSMMNENKKFISKKLKQIYSDLNSIAIKENEYFRTKEEEVLKSWEEIYNSIINK